MSASDRSLASLLVVVECKWQTVGFLNLQNVFYSFPIIFLESFKQDLWDSELLSSLSCQSES